MQNGARCPDESGERLRRTFQAVDDRADDQLRKSADDAHQREGEQAEGDHALVARHVGKQVLQMVPAGRGFLVSFHGCWRRRVVR